MYTALPLTPTPSVAAASWQSNIGPQKVTQNCQSCALCTSSGIQILENTAFRKLDGIPSSGDGRVAPALLGLLEWANFSNWTDSFQDRNWSSFRNAVFSSTQNAGRWARCRTPVILSVIHNWQNPLDSSLSIQLQKVLHTRLGNSRSLFYFIFRGNCFLCTSWETEFNLRKSILFDMNLI
jgi:hypothetical protein